MRPAMVVEGPARPPLGSAHAFAVASVAFLAALAMLWNGASISGPFIFGDEAQYFAYARDLFLGANLDGHTQYGVLYPAIGALSFHLGDADSAYRAMRAFNVAAFVSSAIPAFLLARTVFPENRTMAILFPAFVVGSPFSGFVYVIWADPLYYPLSLWAAYLLYRYFEAPGLRRAIMAGVAIGLLFPAKPGAGLVVGAAAFISVAAFIALSPRPDRRHRIASAATLFLISALLTVPWIVRNLLLNVGPIGYVSGTSLMSARLAELGMARIALELAVCALYQIAYLLVGTFGLLGVVFVLPFSRRRALPPTLLSLAIFIAAWIAGLVALSAVGMTSFGGSTYIGYWLPNGRYLGVVFAIAVFVAVRLLTLPMSPSRAEKKVLVGATVALGAVAAIATPLLVLAPYTFVNNTDLALLVWLVDKGNLMWRSLYEPSLPQVVGYAAFLAACGIGAVLLAARRTAIMALLAAFTILNATASLAEHHYMRLLGESQSGSNDVMRFLGGSGRELGGVAAFDPKLEGGNFDFMAKFWLGNDARVSYSPALAQGDGSRTPRKYFVSRDELALPVAYRSGGVTVYALPQGASR